MPTCGFDYVIDRTAAKRRKAWIAHYMAKGCSQRKAECCAWRKHRTMPPK